MKKRIFRSIFLVSLIMMILTGLLLGGLFYREAEKNINRELEVEANLMNNILTDEGLKTIGKLSQSIESRVTLIAPDGLVSFDSFTEASKMPKHDQRQEFIDAMNNGFGSAKRLSDTLGYMTYYYAVKTNEGSVLRLSLQSRSIWGMMTQSLPLLLFSMLIIVILSAFCSSLLAKAILKPLEEIDLDHPLSDNNGYKEMQALLIKLDEQNKKVNLQIKELKQQRSEFEQLTSQMSEALVILSSDSAILSMNKSAKKIFGAPEAKTALQLCRQEAFISAVNSALQGNGQIITLEIGSRYFEVSVNPVDNLSGVVVLARDVTEKEIAEAARRDFSANVSHELKTPLTSIMGYAELIKTGMAQSQDITLFGQTIYNDATRLLTIIEDTIRLSHLENGNLRSEFTLVELPNLCKNAVSQLESKAKEKEVSVSYTGPDSLQILSVEALVSEMIYNLLDNAISYNKAGGKACLELQKGEKDINLKVADNGIGIPAEMQDRVFERFFRVDKSRSRLTGGTGLGLSIVKHSALILGAKIGMESKLGQGTQITLSFPRTPGPSLQ